jgi:excinuclease ABC subunit A
VKLATELARKATGRTLYVLDEPTTGLHFSDVELLTHALFGLRDAGNTVLIIEHNLDLVSCCDWVIDMGPEGGENGGRIVVEGTPEDVAAHPESHTGRFLGPVLDAARDQAEAARRHSETARRPAASNSNAAKRVARRR